jgi:hypothetical protein
MSNNNNQQLALIGNGGGMQLALAPVDMRQRQLDDFDVCANPELLEMFIGVACHLNTIQCVVCVPTEEAQLTQRPQVLPSRQEPLSGLDDAVYPRLVSVCPLVHPGCWRRHADDCEQGVQS